MSSHTLDICKTRHMCSCASVHSLSVADKANKLQLAKLQNDLTVESEKRRQTAETVKRLSRKFLLASKVLPAVFIAQLLFLDAAAAYAF